MPTESFDVAARTKPTAPLPVTNSVTSSSIQPVDTAPASAPNGLVGAGLVFQVIVSAQVVVV